MLAVNRMNSYVRPAEGDNDRQSGVCLKDIVSVNLPAVYYKLYSYIHAIVCINCTECTQPAWIQACLLSRK